MWRRVDEFLEIVQLPLAVAVSEGKMHEKDRQVLEFQFDNQPFHAAGEKVKSFAVH